MCVREREGEGEREGGLKNWSRETFQTERKGMKDSIADGRK